jgi:Tfp pilus assembly protein PilE
LVELLVVIAIIGVLIAILLPAVQAAREAARRMTCSSNMKNVALAMHNYHDTCKKFPPGGLSDCHNTWAIFIFPFMEQQAIYNQYNLSNTYNGAPNYQLLHEFRVPAYCCPSDGKIISSYHPGNYNHYKHNLVVCAGNTGVFPPDGTQSVIAAGTIQNPEGTGWVYQLGTGTNAVTHKKAVFAVNRWRNTTDTAANTYRCPAFGINYITDGTSNTMFLSETVQGDWTGTNNDLRGYIWWGTATFYTAYYGPNTTNRDCGHGFFGDSSLDKNRFPLQSGGLTAYARDGTQSSVNAIVLAARSYHPMGVHVAMADASVQFKTNTIGINIWRAISTSQGGEENVEEE